MAWKASVYSAIGSRHEQKGQPCQDYGQYVVHGSCLLGAIADGAGSAKHAEVGAKVAVQAVLEAMAAHFLANGMPPDVSELATTVHDQFYQVVQQVRVVLGQEADESGYALRDLACTLIAFLATSDGVLAMQIGDGFIVCRASADDPYQLLFEPDKGEYINETIFVTTEVALDYMRTAAKLCPHPFICAATDGLERVAIRFQDWQPFQPFFAPFQACLAQYDSQDDRDFYLQTFLESDRLRAKTDDDKTLLTCLFTAEQEDLS